MFSSYMEFCQQPFSVFIVNMQYDNSKGPQHLQIRVLSLLLSFVFWDGFRHLWNLASMNISDLRLQGKSMYQRRALSKLLLQRRFSSFKASNKVIQIICRLYPLSLSIILYVPMNYFKSKISNIKFNNQNASAVT